MRANTLFLLTLVHRVFEQPSNLKDMPEELQLTSCRLYDV
jgi:hypothetical protein